MLETAMDQEKVSEKPKFDRAMNVTSFQKSFIPSYKQMFKSMMCDVLAHAETDGKSHYFVRRPFWNEGVKGYQYGVMIIPHSSKVGKNAYAKMVESDEFWDKCYDLYLALKQEMFDSLTDKRWAQHILRDLSREMWDNVNYEDFVVKAQTALDKK
jgi:hypothetical protein